MEEGATERPLLERHVEEGLAPLAASSQPPGASAEGGGSLIARARRRGGAAAGERAAGDDGAGADDDDCYALLADGPPGDATPAQAARGPLRADLRPGGEEDGAPRADRPDAAQLPPQPPQPQPQEGGGGCGLVPGGAESAACSDHEDGRVAGAGSAACQGPAAPASLAEPRAAAAALPAEGGAPAPPKARLQRRRHPAEAQLAGQAAGSPGSSGGIEMSSLGGAAGADQDVAAVAVGSQKPLGQEDRHCFICLQDEDKDNPLVPCCSTCFARTHVRCWREWRNNQRMTALRSRLLGLRTQTNHLLRCTICKSGTAMLAGEEDGLEWMNDLLSGGDAGDSGPGGAGPGAGGGMRRGGEDSDEDDGDGQLEDLIDVRTCVALVTYLAVLIVVLTVAIGLVMLDWFYAGDVVLCSIIALYELSVLLIVALAVARRRSTTLAAAEAALSLLGAGSSEGGRAGGADDDSTPRALESGDLRRAADSSPAEAGARRASWLQMAAWEHEASV